jgi:YD repeat-containing protein
MRRPDGSRIQFTYDPNGNLTVLTNPNLVDHGFGYNGVNRQTSYETPLSGGYAYIYDRDRRLIRTVFPSAKEIQYLYDVQHPGRLTRIQTPEGNIDYAYYPCGAKTQSITGHNETIAYGYDGSLVTTETFSGTLNTALAYGYNPDFNITSIAYAGGAETLTYDQDGLLIGAGRFAIARNAANGLPESVTGDAFALSRTFTGYGEIGTQAVAVGGQHLAAWDLTVDHAGRIASKTETVDGVLTPYAYAYDDLGRLRTVSKDGVLVAEYRYNANGSRIYEMNALRGISGRDLIYSDEDHLLTAGETVYAYDLDGFLQTRTDGADVTTYEYSSRGELLGVTLPDGTIIGYLHDPLGRRIAKQVNGVIVEKYLWAGRTRLLAVFDGSGNLKMRFEYADGRLPYAVTMGGSVYYLAYDQVGSLRAVADASGTVVKEVIYDAFGNVLSDANPALAIPFGFCGG